jgi:hypothetical protein
MRCLASDANVHEEVSTRVACSVDAPPVGWTFSRSALRSSASLRMLLVRKASERAAREREMAVYLLALLLVLLVVYLFYAVIHPGRF